MSKKFVSYLNLMVQGSDQDYGPDQELMVLLFKIVFIFANISVTIASVLNECASFSSDNCCKCLQASS